MAPSDEQDEFSDILDLLVEWGLPPGDAEYVLDGAISLRELRPRETLFQQGAPVTHVYLLRSGTLYQDRVSEAGERSRISLRREVVAGQLIGQYDLLYGQAYSTRVRALDHCKVVAVEANALNRLLYAYPEVRESIAPLELIARLRTLPLFEQLDATSLSLVAEMCEQLDLEDADEVYTTYDRAEWLYAIDEGQIYLESPVGEVSWLGNGMEFGFLEIPHDDPAIVAQLSYGHTAIAVGKVRLFSWPREAILELSGIHPERTGQRLGAAREHTLRSLSVFAKFTTDQKRQLLGYMSHIYFPISQVVMQQGEAGDSLWVLMPDSRATLRALDGAQALQPTTVYGPNFFSELSLRIDHPLDSTVQAEAGSQWMRLHRDDFLTFLKDTDRSLMNQLVLSPAAEGSLGQAKITRHYAWLQQGEKLIEFRRRHPLVLLRRLTVSALMLVLLAAVVYGFYQMQWTQQWVQLTLAAPSMIILWIIAWNIVNYLNDYVVVTNQRVVHQERVLFLSEWRKGASLEQVRNIDVQTTFMGRLLDYGTITIQTAATEGAIKFDFVTRPAALKQTILDEQSKRRQHYQASTKMVIQGLLQERLGLRLQIPSRVTALRVDDTHATFERIRERLSALRKRLWKPKSLQERVVWRKHWLLLLGRILLPLLLLLGVASLFAGQQFLPETWHQVLPAVDIGIGVFAAIALLWILWSYLDWGNDTYEIDYNQIADVDKKPLFFAENRRTALLSEIENIEVSIPSPIHFLFNFGNVRIQTAATEGDFTFDWVPNPRAVSEEVRRRMEVNRQRLEDARAKQRAEELPDWFEMYDRLGVEMQNDVSAEASSRRAAKR